MSSTLNVYGPPGTGKTRRLIAQILKAIDRVGPQGVGAVTYTRNAARDLSQRIGRVLGIPIDDQTLRRELPWIGTLHSISYKLLKLRPDSLVDENALRSFCADERIHAPANLGQLLRSPEALDTIDWEDPVIKAEEIVHTLRLLSSARHRLGKIEDVIGDLPGEAAQRLSVDRIVYLARRYDAWKRARGKVDFEDLLIAGAMKAPPVQALFLDEAQDNSPLLWSVFDSWAAQCPYVFAVGDPWQAIYIFSGGNPTLFSQRAGEWRTLRQSHRLTPQAVAYAIGLLRGAGWQHDLLATWSGVGGHSRDGTTFYIARTNRLVHQLRRQLLEDGEPFLGFSGRGTAPWDTKDGQAVRIGLRLLGGEQVDGYDATLLVKQLKKKAPATWTPDAPVSVAQVERVVSGSLRDNLWRLKYASYIFSAHRRYGSESLSQSPRTFLGTIHGSKGLEADRVCLVTSWARLPAASLGDPQGGLNEACVAYVGATRHRSQLELIDVNEGIRYPFPPLVRSEAS